MAHYHDYANEVDFWNANEVVYTPAQGCGMWCSQ